MITTTALVDAGRQIAAWLDRTLRDNDQADAITELGSLADSVSCGFNSPTVHGSDLVGRAKEDVASGESEPRTIVRMALVPMALPGNALR